MFDGVYVLMAPKYSPNNNPRFSLSSKTPVKRKTEDKFASQSSQLADLLRGISTTTRSSLNFMQGLNIHIVF